MKPTDYTHQAFNQYWKVEAMWRVFRHTGTEWKCCKTTLKDIEKQIQTETFVKKEQARHSVSLKASLLRGKPLTANERKIGATIQTSSLKATADRFGVSIGTIKHQCYRIYRKLGIKNMKELRKMDLLTKLN